MIISNFVRIGRPKAEYDAEGNRTGESSQARTFAVLDVDDKPIGNITASLDTLDFSHLDVAADEYEGRKYFRIKRTFKNKAELQSYLDNNGDEATELIAKAAKVKLISFK